MYFHVFSVEIFLSLAILAHLLYNTFFFVKREHLTQNLLGQGTQIYSILLAAIFILIKFHLIADFQYSNGFFSYSPGTIQLKLIFLIFNFCAFYVIYYTYFLENLKRFEYFTLYLLFILGSCLLISSDHLFSAYLTIEMLSLISYIFATYKHNSIFSVNAGISYFIAGAIFSVMFLVGLVMLYSTFGALSVLELANLNYFSLDREYERVLYIAYLFVFIAIFAKLLVAPFHFWAINIYEGLPLSTFIIFLFLSKFSLIVFLLKLITSMGYFLEQFKLFFIITGILSIAFGTFGALEENRFKKLLFFSSIANMGFIIFGLTQNSSVHNVIAFLIIYSFTLLMLLLVLMELHFQRLVFMKTVKILKNAFFSIFFIRDYRNRYDINVWIFIFLLFSLAGLPPFPLFFAKVQILLEALADSYVIFTLIVMFLSTLGMYYNIRLLKIYIFDPTLKPIQNNIEKIKLTSDWSTMFRTFSIYYIILFVFLLVLTIEFSVVQLNSYNAIINDIILFLS
jgi:NADH-quinone oxidoreductase subunit N